MDFRKAQRRRGKKRTNPRSTWKEFPTPTRQLENSNAITKTSWQIQRWRESFKRLLVNPTPTRKHSEKTHRPPDESNADAENPGSPTPARRRSEKSNADAKTFEKMQRWHKAICTNRAPARTLLVDFCIDFDEHFSEFRWILRSVLRILQISGEFS